MPCSDWLVCISFSIISYQNRLLDRSRSTILDLQQFLTQHKVILEHKALFLPAPLRAHMNMSAFITLSFFQGLALPSNSSPVCGETWAPLPFQAQLTTHFKAENSHTLFAAVVTTVRCVPTTGWSWCPGRANRCCVIVISAP